MIGVCTDSNAQLTAELAEQLGIAVVPLTVTLDGVDHLEHVDLDADAFYAAFRDDARPQVSTAAPGPGRFLAAWQELVGAGADHIVSVHIGADLSGTLNAAHLAARDAPVPVHLVDTGTASFAVAAAAWAAADAAKAGASAEEAAAAAEATARRCDNVFVVGTLDLARAGGRLAGDDGADAGLPVLRLAEGKMQTVGRAASAGEAADTMAATITGAGDVVRVAVGWSDETSLVVADALSARLEASATVERVVRYRVGPSVGAHTGPGTAGAVWWPVSG